MALSWNPLLFSFKIYGPKSLIYGVELYPLLSRICDCLSESAPNGFDIFEVNVEFLNHICAPFTLTAYYLMLTNEELLAIKFIIPN